MYKYAGLAALLVILASAVLFFVFQKQDIRVSRAEKAALESNSYDFDLIFRPDDKELAVTMTLSFRNDTQDSLFSLCLRTFANACAREDTSPAALDEIYDACYPDGFSAGSLTVEGVWWNGEIAGYSYLDDARTVLNVSIPELLPGASGTLFLHARLHIPVCAHRFGVSDGVWQFGYALPVLSVYEDGAWRTDEYSMIGDSLITACADYHVSLLVPAEYACVSGGTLQSEEIKSDGTKLLILRGTALRDFTFALSSVWSASSSIKNGLLLSVSAENESCSSRILKIIQKILPVYESLYGEYPYSALTVYTASSPLEDTAYSALIALDSDWLSAADDDTLELALAHALAHQWFYALVGSDSINQAWQDEALCEFAMLRCMRKLYGVSAYENLLITRVNAPMREKIAQSVTPGAPLSYFGSSETYRTVVYGRGAALLVALDEITEGKIDSLLKDYCDAFAFDFAARQDFTSFISEHSGMDIAPLMVDYLDTYGY